MKHEPDRVFVGDFETTVYSGQQETEVWASALIELYSEDVKVFNSIEKTMFELLKCRGYIVVYYHNLKFDGSFWLYYLISKHFTHAYNPSTEYFMDTDDMPNLSYKYVISRQGQWYTITIKINSKLVIELRDSLKLLPFSVRKIGESFGTAHKKLEMEYVGVRHANGIITEDEEKYIKNDVLVVKEAIEIMYKDGHKKLTIGSCCLEEFKRIVRTGYTRRYEELFPNLYEMPLDKETYGFDNMGSYILSSYKGGWCYLVPEKANRVFEHGTTADVNSLYPSVMSGSSSNRYPVGVPGFFHKGEPIESPTTYYFIRIKTKFKLKEGYLPTIQLKGNPLYKSTEYLTTSDIYNKTTGKYDDYYIDIYGNPRDAIVTMTLTKTDYHIFKEHYDISYLEILSFCVFATKTAEELFDEYISKYKLQKMKNKGALREEAKLFLNNLYGKLASTTDSSYKTVEIKDEHLAFSIHYENEKRPGYIPIGSAITSYARAFTQRAAQINYHGVDKPGFIYADTDSIHCDLAPNEMKGIQTDDNEFLKWKLESCWDKAIFVRQKTYIERITHENLKPVEKPYYNIKCAGMNDRCKYQLNKSLLGEEITEEDKKKYNEEQIKFMSEKRELTDFKIGLQIFGKLRPVQIKGGVVLYEDYYTMH